MTKLSVGGITAGTLVAAIQVGAGGVIRAGAVGVAHLDLTSAGLTLYGPDGITPKVTITPAGAAAAGIFTADDPTLAGSAFMRDGAVGFTDTRNPLASEGKWGGAASATPVGPQLTRAASGGLRITGRMPYRPSGPSYDPGASLVLDSIDGFAGHAGTKTAVLDADTGRVGPVSWDSLYGVGTTAAIDRTLDYGVWSAAALAGAWVNFGAGFPTAAYRLNLDGSVSLRGLVKLGAVGNIFTIPVAAYRPQNTESFVVVVNAGTAYVTVSPAGLVNLYVYHGTGTNAYVSLAGIRWRVD